MLNSRNHVLRIADAAKGTLTAAKIYPREVMKLILRYSTAAVVFAHNHPSGVAQPSDDDRQITRDLVHVCVLLGIKVHDHLIIGDNSKFSFADEGLLDRYETEFNQRRMK